MKNLFTSDPVRTHIRAAKTLALSAATFTALIAIFVPSPFVITDPPHSISLGVAINILLLLLSFVGWADLIWHDLHGGLIFRRMSNRARHHFCVLFYAALAGIFGVRAFAVAGDLPSNILIGFYFLATAVGIALIAVAIAQESR